MGAEAPWSCVGPVLAQHHNALRWCELGLLATSPAACRVGSRKAPWPPMAVIRANPQYKTEVASESAAMTPSPILSSTILTEGQ